MARISVTYMSRVERKMLSESWRKKERAGGIDRLEIYTAICIGSRE